MLLPHTCAPAKGFCVQRVFVCLCVCVCGGGEWLLGFPKEWAMGYVNAM